MNAPHEVINPWMQSICSNMSSDVIKGLADLPATPIQSIDSLDTATLLKLVDEHLKKTYVATGEQCRVLEALVSVVLGHYAVNYCSEIEYHRRTQAPEDLDIARATSDRSAILFTGLAGCGKSETLKALLRVLPATEISLTQQPMVVTSHPVLDFRLAANSAEKHLVIEAMGRLNGRKISQRNTISSIQDELSQLLFVKGVGLLTFDELQFLSKSEGSVQKAVSFLVDALKLRVPLLYCANYSLVHKLMNRPSEEKQRLLSNVIELYPERQGSADWLHIVSETRKVAPSIFDYEPEMAADDLYRWTAGLSRLLRQLMYSALQLVANEKKPRVTKAVLKQAFFSKNFTSNRNDVEDIIRIAVEPTYGKKHLDICSPFPRETKAKEFFDAINTQQLERATEAAAMSAFPAGIQLAYATSQKSSPKAPVSPIRRSKGSTTANLVANTQAAIESALKNRS